jgi:ribosomal protein S5
MFTWIKAALPLLTSVSFQFDTGKSLFTGTMTGTGFTAGSTANTELWIDGFKQVTTSVSGTEANFDITNTLDVYSTDIQFYLPEGVP